jgi:hypothetical protein
MPKQASLLVRPMPEIRLCSRIGLCRRPKEAGQHGAAATLSAAAAARADEADGRRRCSTDFSPPPPPEARSLPALG